MAQFKSNMTINVSCVTPFICVTFKTTLRRNSQEGRFCHRTVLFPVIRRYCSADVKMLVFLSLLPHKNRRRRQNMSLICQVANTHAHENIYSPDLFISGTPGHPNTQCTFCGAFLSCRKCYIDCEFDVNLEQTDKSVCYELDEVMNSFWKKPVGISPACCFPLCRWKCCNKIIPPKVTELQLRLFNNLHFHPQKCTK